MRSLLLWVVAGVVGVIVAAQLVFVAFPEASIDFKVTPAEATGIARDFLAARGISVAGYESAVVLKVDEDAKKYLEREVGLERANALMGSDVSVFAFNVRFFRDMQQEEFGVRVDPTGRVVGMSHVVEEARAGARLDGAAARRVAESFLREVEPRFGEYDYLVAEENSDVRPNRRDWRLTWERRDFGAKDAPYRLRVMVLGDEAGRYEQFLRVPDGWKRDFDRLRSENVVYGLIGTAAWVLLVLSVVVALVRLIRRGAVRWRAALGLGAALAVVFAALALNALPLALANYQTTSSYAGFLASRVVGAIIGAAALAAFMAVVFVVAEPGYRERWPERLRLAVAWRPRALGTREVFRSLVIGLSLAGANLGAVVLFYVLGRRVGVWAPQEIRYDESVGTTFPWLFPLGIGIEAASHEEFLFRLFAIPLLLRVTKNPVLAILLPAFGWGFGHATYPVEPGYVRGIEVGMTGVVMGLVFLRYGILPTLIWHYTYYAVLIGLLLIRSENAYFVISGAIVGFAVALPLLAAGALLVARRRFVEDPTLLNAADPVAPQPAAGPASDVLRVYEPASSGTLRLALAVGAAGALLFALVRLDFVGSFIESRLIEPDAVRLATEVLRARGLDTARYQRVATFGGMPSESSLTRATTSRPALDPYANEYLRREIGVAGANRLYAEQVPSIFWRVRYFRDGEKEEYTVLLRPDGKLHTVLHRRDEQAPGANLSKDEAQRVAERYLSDEQSLALEMLHVVEAASEKQPNRTDHTIVWERAEAIGGAHVRAEVKVLGDEVAGYRVFVKVPDEWERDQRRRSFGQTVYAITRGLVIGALVVATFVLFFRNLRQRVVPWSRLAIVAAVAAAFTVTASLNGLPRIFARYPTETPFASYLLTALAGDLFSGLFFFVIALFLGGAAWLFVSLAFGEERMPTPRAVSAYWRDAAVLGLAGAGVFLLISRMRSFAELVWPMDHVSLAARLPADLDTYVPAVGALAFVPFAALVATALVAIGLALVARYVRSPALRVVCALILAALFVDDLSRPEQVARDYIGGLVLIGAGVFWAMRVARFNALAYALAIALALLATRGLELLGQPNAAYQANGALVLALGAAIAVAPIIMWRRTVRRRLSAEAALGD